MLPFLAVPVVVDDDAGALHVGFVTFVNAFFFFSAAARSFDVMNIGRPIDDCGFPFASGALSPEFLLPRPMHHSRLRRCREVDRTG